MTYFPFLYGYVYATLLTIWAIEYVKCLVLLILVGIFIGFSSQPILGTSRKVICMNSIACCTFI
jgi:hypothetical protein